MLKVHLHERACIDILSMLYTQICYSANLNHKNPNKISILPTVVIITVIRSSLWIYYMYVCWKQKSTVHLIHHRKFVVTITVTDTSWMLEHSQHLHSHSVFVDATWSVKDNQCKNVVYSFGCQQAGFNLCREGIKSSKSCVTISDHKLFASLGWIK